MFFSPCTISLKERKHTPEKTIQIGKTLTEEYQPFNPASTYTLQPTNMEQLSRMGTVIPNSNAHTHFQVDSDSKRTIAAAIGLYLPFITTETLSSYKVQLQTTKDGPK